MLCVEIKREVFIMTVDTNTKVSTIELNTNPSLKITQEAIITISEKLIRENMETYEVLAKY